MDYNKRFFEKVFSDRRMERYFMLHPDDEEKAIAHYECNLRLSEAMYVPLSVFEVTLRNALSRQLRSMTGREDWYAMFSNRASLGTLNRYVLQAMRQIQSRREQITPTRVVSELTLGFWVSLLNSEYERVLWKDLRKAFPFMPKELRQRKNISAPLNRFRGLRNHVFHNKPICWNLYRVAEIHAEIIEVLGWMNRDVPEWLSQHDRVPAVISEIRQILNR